VTTRSLPVHTTNPTAVPPVTVLEMSLNVLRHSNATDLLRRNAQTDHAPSLKSSAHW
jgi:hypothetical protein